jgi:putative phosphoesterase
MRIAVVSDSHGDYSTLKLVAKAQISAEVIVHCGDGASDIIKLKSIYKDKCIIAVKGNCDLASSLPDEELININSSKIFITHGNKYSVKMGYSSIIYHALEVNANILLFGHTHNAFTSYENGLYIMNPGTLRGVHGTYGIIDITNAGIFMNIIHTHLLYR